MLPSYHGLPNHGYGRPLPPQGQPPPPSGMAPRNSYNYGGGGGMAAPPAAYTRYDNPVQYV